MSSSNGQKLSSCRSRPQPRNNSVSTRTIEFSGQFAPSDGENLRRLLASAVNAVNLLARAFRGEQAIKKRFYKSKHELLSLALERAVPEVRPDWQRQDDGSYLLIIKIGDLLSPHCPFEGLTWNAQCRVVECMGAAPQVPSSRRC